MILYSEGGSKLEEADSHYVLCILCDAYPGHPWAVYVNGGVIMIKYLDPALGAGWGMATKFSKVKHDATAFKHEIIMKAGEWLERAGLVRGRNDGTEIVHVEGIPQKDQPHQPLPPGLTAVVNRSHEIRTQPRPQALAAARNDNG